MPMIRPPEGTEYHGQQEEGGETGGGGGPHGGAPERHLGGAGTAAQAHQEKDGHPHHAGQGGNRLALRDGDTHSGDRAALRRGRAAEGRDAPEPGYGIREVPAGHLRRGPERDARTHAGGRLPGDVGQERHGEPEAGTGGGERHHPGALRGEGSHLVDGHRGQHAGRRGGVPGDPPPEHEPGRTENHEGEGRAPERGRRLPRKYWKGAPGWT